MKSRNGTCPNLDAALLYADMGLSCFPLPRGSKAPARGFKWTEYRERRANRHELREWFGDGEQNIGIITGDVSGDLVVRDFDEPGAYERWRDAHRDAAEALPTVKTARGHHVYARGAADHTVICADGELRAAGSYVVAPSSVHPSGITYTWTQPLRGDDIPVADLVELGWTLGNTEGAGHSVSSVSSVLPAGVSAAIRRTIPPNVGWREKCLFRLCRELQAIPEFTGVDPRSLEPIVREWYSVSEPHIGTKEYGVSLATFVRAWGRVRVPKGETVVHAALARVREADLSWIPATIDNEGMRLLVTLCRELQAIAGDQPFYLDCRTAGDVLGVSHKTAWQWLDSLCVLGVLDKVSSGSLATRKANEYRWRGCSGDD